MISKYESARRQREEFEAEVEELESPMLRKFLLLVYHTKIEKWAEFQVRNESERKQRLDPGIKAVHKKYGWSKNTACKYLNALNLLFRYMDSPNGM